MYFSLSFVGSSNVHLLNSRPEKVKRDTWKNNNNVTNLRISVTHSIMFPESEMYHSGLSWYQLFLRGSLGGKCTMLVIHGVYHALVFTQEAMTWNPTKNCEIGAIE